MVVQCELFCQQTVTLDGNAREFLSNRQKLPVFPPAANIRWRAEAR